jgi:hypothetical protein
VAEVTRQLPAQAPPPPPSGAGEFTQLFQSPAASPVAEVTRQLPARMVQASESKAPPEPARPAQGPPATPPPAGEFTRMFQSADVGPPATPPRAPSPAPGEFTSIFNAAPAPVSQQAQSEANRMFTPPGGPSNPVPFATPAANPLGQPAPGSTSPFAAHLPAGSGASFGAKPPSVQDDYAKLFGPGTAPAPPPAAGGGFGATSAFNVPQPFAQGAPAQSGPSEYTRMIARPEAADIPPPPAPQPQAPAAPKRPVWLFVILGVVLVGLLIGLIVTLLR